MQTAKICTGQRQFEVLIFNAKLFSASFASLCLCVKFQYLFDHYTNSKNRVDFAIPNLRSTIER